MAINRLFTPLPANGGDTVNITFNGETLHVAAGRTVAATLLAAGAPHFRTTPVSESPRAPYCMMGVCFDCLIEIDGVPNRQACLVEVAEGMRLRTQIGAREFAIDVQETRHDA
jgi:predicted molibdopterin-dependent oxidoreductase YjgC